MRHQGIDVIQGVGDYWKHVVVVRGRRLKYRFFASCLGSCDQSLEVSDRLWELGPKGLIVGSEFWGRRGTVQIAQELLVVSDQGYGSFSAHCGVNELQVCRSPWRVYAEAHPGCKIG